MRFGHFDDTSREYVLETPRTPYPSINYRGTEERSGGGKPAKLVVDGRPVEGTLVPWAPAGRTLEVACEV